MVGTALFYGRDQSTLSQDIVASFITSLFGKLPSFAIRHIFMKTKPRKTDSTKIQRANSFSRRRSVSLKRRRSSTAQLTESASKSQRFQQVSDIRMRLYENKYKYPQKCREIGWCILLFISITGCITAILYGLSFDLQVKASMNSNNPNEALYASDCWNTSLHLRIENDLSVEIFEEQYAERDAMNKGSYGGSDAGSWLLSLFQSLLLSLFLWQPLIIYIVTWFKVWMFTWHLEMKVFFNIFIRSIYIFTNIVHTQFPEQCPALISKCCRRVSDEDVLSVQMTARSNSIPPSTRTTTLHVDVKSGTLSRASVATADSLNREGVSNDPSWLHRTSSRRSVVLANAQRPDDVLSFYADVEYHLDVVSSALNIK